MYNTAESCKNTAENIMSQNTDTDMRATNLTLLLFFIMPISSTQYNRPNTHKAMQKVALNKTYVNIQYNNTHYIKPTLQLF